MAKFLPPLCRGVKSYACSSPTGLTRFVSSRHKGVATLRRGESGQSGGGDSAAGLSEMSVFECGPGFFIDYAFNVLTSLST